jgi:hypothetical protein
MQRARATRPRPNAAGAQAYDLAALREVAVKVHQLAPGWGEARRASYVRHAVRRPPAARRAQALSVAPRRAVPTHDHEVVCEHMRPAQASVPRPRLAVPVPGYESVGRAGLLEHEQVLV